MALKIFDEKRNSAHPHVKLDFYVTLKESSFVTLADEGIQSFIKRINGLRNEASTHYQSILQDWEINIKNPGHVRAVVAICEAFQDYSFVRLAATDLYQLVFYNFANSFKRDEAAQFLTPIPVIDFIVKIVNPRSGERLLDPCLSLSFVNSRKADKPFWLDDANIYGVDLDDKMITLATLNMLLNGDGEAKLFEKPDRGSILSKVAINPPRLVELSPAFHRKGNWDNWPDQTSLLKFNVVLTNPPFGEDRASQVRNERDREIASLYETYLLSEKQESGSGKATRRADSIDLGVLFLENAIHSLKEGGRLGIVLSNSIASINKWAQVRQWFMKKMRIVALFDLPPNVFAETGVNTSIIIAYKPTAKEQDALETSGYSVFTRDIKRVGYERRTAKRNVFFKPKHKIDETTFEIAVDENGAPIIDEEFSELILKFRTWALTQEKRLQDLFFLKRWEMKYVDVPQAISASEIAAADWGLSPGRYVQFIPPVGTNDVEFVPLDQIVQLSTATERIKRSRWYHYAEIGSIDPETGLVGLAALRGYEVPARTALRLDPGFIMISTVRTYRMGIGIVAEPASNMIASGAIMLISGIKPPWEKRIDLHYL